MNSPRFHIDKAVEIVSHKFSVSASQSDMLVRACELVRERFASLIPASDLRRFESRTVLGSLILNAVLRETFPSSTRLADVGSGLGFPGIPLAILNPEKEFLLLDSNMAKVNAAIEISASLGLKNLKVMNQDGRFKFDNPVHDVLIGRRVAPVSEFFSACAVHSPSLGCLYLCGFKAASSVKNIDQLIPFESVASPNFKLPVKGECVAVVSAVSLKNFVSFERWSEERRN